MSSSGRARVEDSIPEDKEVGPALKRTPGSGKGGLIFSPGENRLAEDSPQPLTDQERERLETASLRPDGISPHERRQPVSLSAPPGQLISAPAEMHQRHRKVTVPITVAPSETIAIDPSGLRRPVELDPEAPKRAVRDQQKRGPAKVEQVEDEDGVKRKDTALPKAPDVRYHSEPPPTTEVDGAGPSTATGEGEPVQWGTPFKIEWVRVQRLPFYRTRHLRNPWNHDREVKVSRDGTELDPIVGQALLDEWDKPDPPAPTSAPGPGPPPPPQARRGGGGGGGRTQSSRGGGPPMPSSGQYTQHRQQQGGGPQK